MKPFIPLLAAVCGFACATDTYGLGDAGASRRDGDLTADAEPADVGLDARDGAPSRGGYWTLEPVFAQLTASRSDLRVQLPLIRIDTYPDHACQYGGPVEFERIGNEFQVRAYAWIDHQAEPGEDPCLFVTDQVPRMIPFDDLEPGTYRFTELVGGSSVELRVDGDPGQCLPAGQSDCASSCECEDSCIPCWQDSNCLGRCGESCTPVTSGCCGEYQPEVDLECDEGFMCDRSVSGLFSGKCEPRDSDGCAEDCPPGMRCVEIDGFKECAWEIRLNSSTRHPCIESGDCAPGMVCVESGSSGGRKCEVPCLSNRMRCPIAHVCGPPSPGRAPWVCEWVGE